MSERTSSFRSSSFMGSEVNLLQTREQALLSEVESLQLKIQQKEAMIKQDNGLRLTVELKAMQERIAEAQQQNQNLRDDIDRLTRELIDMESTQSVLNEGPSNPVKEGRRRNTMEIFEQGMQKTEREEMLETAVVKTKKEKEQAIRIIIKLVGKPTVQEILRQVEEHPEEDGMDVFDRVLTAMSTSQAAAGKKTSSTAKKSPKGRPSPDGKSPHKQSSPTSKLTTSMRNASLSPTRRSLSPNTRALFQALDR